MDYWYAFKHIIQPDVLLREYVILKSATSGSMIITSTNSEMFLGYPFSQSNKCVDYHETLIKLIKCIYYPQSLTTSVILSCIQWQNIAHETLKKKLHYHACYNYNGE